MTQNWDITTVANAINVSLIQLQNWIKRGYIPISDAPGHGVKRTLTLNEAIKISSLKEIASLGVQPKLIAHHLKSLYSFSNEPAYLVIRRFPLLGVDGTEVYSDSFEEVHKVSEIVRESELIERLKLLPGALVINLDEIEESIKESLGGK